MRILHLDCFSGISGDMTVAALHDIGVPEEVFQQAITSLQLGGEIHAHFGRTDRQGISAASFHVHGHGEEHHHPHQHDHPHGHTDGHSHGRNHREIRELVERSHLSPNVKNRVLAVFQRIAVAEAKIHGIPVEEIGFHEVGAIDSIADIVAACAGFEFLSPAAVHASAPVEGSGWIDCAHGKFPIPAPATLEILSGIPLRQIDEPFEFITPTGAALLAEFAVRFGSMPALRIDKTGFGAGSRDTPHRPNVLRAILGEALESADPDADEIAQIETNLDDLTPEIAGHAMDRLFQAGALDVFITPAQMKKNRPGFVLTVLCEPEKTSALSHLILAETTAFGVRIHRASRLKLRREFREAPTPFGPVRVKLGFLHGKLVQASPEFESCKAVAETAGALLRDVYNAAQGQFALCDTPPQVPPTYSPKTRL